MRIKLIPTLLLICLIVFLRLKKDPPTLVCTWDSNHSTDLYCPKYPENMPKSKYMVFLKDTSTKEEGLILVNPSLLSDSKKCTIKMVNQPNQLNNLHDKDKETQYYFCTEDFSTIKRNITPVGIFNPLKETYINNIGGYGVVSEFLGSYLNEEVLMAFIYFPQELEDGFIQTIRPHKDYNQDAFIFRLNIQKISIYLNEI